MWFLLNWLCSQLIWGCCPFWQLRKSRCHRLSGLPHTQVVSSRTDSLTQDCKREGQGSAGSHGHVNAHRLHGKQTAPAVSVPQRALWDCGCSLLIRGQMQQHCKWCRKPAFLHNPPAAVDGMKCTPFKVDYGSSIQRNSVQPQEKITKRELLRDWYTKVSKIYC